MTDYRSEIEAAASVARLNPDLVEAVVMIESSGRADAFRYEPDFYVRYLQGKAEWARWIPRRASSSYGLMQLMFPTARQIGFSGEPEELFVPKINLYWGCKLLAKLIAWAKGNETKALAAFNGGQAGYKAAAPQAYAVKVLAELARAQGVQRV
jgi:soluble lytic murein transglycosylase-like protein